MTQMTVEERWERLDEALRDKERALMLTSVLRHYAGLAIEAGCDIPCPECRGELDGTQVRECRECGARWEVQAVA